MAIVVSQLYLIGVWPCIVRINNTDHEGIGGTHTGGKLSASVVFAKIGLYLG